MKNIRQFFAAVMFTFLFTMFAFAGQMQTPVAEPPPPLATTEGQMQTPVAGQMTTWDSEAVDPVMQVALSLLQSVMSLF